jgi:predicted RNase H-like HicB family nuclease
VKKTVRDGRTRKEASVPASIAAKAEKYAILQYPFEVEFEEGEYIVTFPDLVGCMSGGPTIEEALKNAAEAKRLWIEVTLERGMEVPEPAGNYSGRLVLRMPKSLHRDLAMRAKREGVSLNQYLISKLAKH